MKGELKTKLIKGGQRVALSWRLGNVLRWDYIKNYISYHLMQSLSRLTGVITATGQLSARLVKADGSYIDYGVVARGLVTDAFVAFMVDELQAETSVWGDFKWHDSGVGTTPAAAADTDIETTDAEARVAGTQIEGATADIYKSVGTITYTTSLAITEHGLFSIVTGGTLMDHHIFAAINVVNTDQIEFTYELTCTAGG